MYFFFGRLPGRARLLVQKGPNQKGWVQQVNTPEDFLPICHCVRHT